MFFAKPLRGGDLDESFALLSNDFTYWSIVTRMQIGQEDYRRAVEAAQADISRSTSELIPLRQRGVKR